MGIRSFAGKTVLLTGAASGIGRACAVELATAGAQLALVDIDADGLGETAAAVRARGARAHTLVADLANEEGVEGVARDALAALGHVDVLFSNAGVAVVAPVVGTKAEDWRWIFDINVWAPIRLTRALLPHMTARGTGYIVYTASLAGLIGAPGMVAYSTTKFALVGFAEALRHEIADKGIDVTVVCPGRVHTNLHRATRYGNLGFRRFLDQAPTWYGVTKERAARIIVRAMARRQPLVVFGGEKLGWWLKRIWPTGGLAAASWMARRLQLIGAHDD